MYTVKIKNVAYISHNVKRFLVEKPEGIQYTPGQSAHISINQPEWKDKIRPFTFTSLQNWDDLEFIIKIYEENEGVTNHLSTLKPGDELLIHDIFGTIKYSGPGIFIAGGTGITPFIPIFRALYHSNNMRGVALLYSNRTREDIILHDELTKILGAAYKNVFTREGVIGFRERRIDRKFLVETIGGFNFKFYVCGPKNFTEDVCDALISLGVNPEYLIV